MRSSIIKVFAVCLLTVSCAAQGKLVRVNNFKSKFVKDRNIDIWLPQQYLDNAAQAFPVVYMHDGQNVFNPETALNTVSLDLHKTAAKLISDEQASPFIIVAMWNTEERFGEFFPEKAAKYLTSDDKEAIERAWTLNDGKKNRLLADEYLKFITKEVKPYIDKNYRTLPDREHTAISGGSMGGLISLYAICEYPDVFGKAACISTHWPVLMDNDNMGPSDAVRKYMEENLPDPATHRIYFDHGTKTLDQYYEMHQQMVDNIMRSKGYKEGNNWVTRKFEGAEHNEKWIKQRMDVIIRFLFPAKVD